MIGDFFKLAISTLIHRKIRSMLTVLGIVIGITAVVALVSLGQGLDKAINEQFNSLGSNRITVTPASGGFGPPSSGTGSAKVTEDDEKIINRVDGVINTFGFLLDPAQATFNSKTKFLYIQGIPNDQNDYGGIAARFEVIQGRGLKVGDKNKVIIGYNLANKDTTFGKTIKIGDNIVIKSKTFDVVGIRKKIGDPVSDDVLVIPIETHRELFDSGNRYAILTAEVSPLYDLDTVAEKIASELRQDRNQDKGEEDFKVQTSAQVAASFKTVLGIVQAVIVGIAAISLIVGGVGIMNTMYTSVLERTKDIGILKSIGAKDSDILMLFLMESGMIGLIGGIIGITFGIALGKLVEFIALQIWGTLLIQATFSPFLIIGSLFFSFIVGSLAGLLPARQASKKNPVDALRYE